MLHRLGLCCCFHHLNHVHAFLLEKCLRNSEHPNGFLFPAASGRKVTFVYAWRWREALSSFWLLPLQWSEGPCLGIRTSVLCGQWEIMGQLGGEMMSLWWKVGSGQAEDRHKKGKKDSEEVICDREKSDWKMHRVKRKTNGGEISCQDHVGIMTGQNYVCQDQSKGC